MVKVFAVHTALAMVEPTTELFKKHLPDVKLNHIVDDSLIQEVIINNMVTPSVAKRLMNCFFMAGLSVTPNMLSTGANEARRVGVCRFCRNSIDILVK